MKTNYIIFDTDKDEFEEIDNDALISEIENLPIL